MIKTLFVDKFEFTPSARTITKEGYLVVPAKIARPGMQLYRGIDLMRAPGFPKEKFKDSDVIKVYRPAEEVFDQASLDSFKNVAVTDDHPPQLLDARTHRKYAVGTVLADVRVSESEDCVDATVKITDADTIKKIQNGKAEVSAGYLSEVCFESGTTPSGEHYDAVQKGIEGNHVAIVDKGRAGDKIRLADAATMMDPTQMPGMKITYGEDTYSIPHESMSYARIGQMMHDSEAEFIREAKIEKDEIRGEVEDEDYKDVNAGKPNKDEPAHVADEGQMEPMVTLPSQKDSDKKGMSLNDSIKDKENIVELEEKVKLLETELETAKADADVAKTALADAESKVPTVDQIDAMVEERASVVAKCKSLVEDIETAGKSNAALKREVVVAKMAHVDAETVSEAYIDAAFDLLKVEKQEKVVEKSQTLDAAFKTEVTDGKKKELSAREKFLEKSRNAWKS